MPRLLSDPWITAYMNFMRAAETPEHFSWWCGIGALATILRRNIWFKRKLITIYPNQYIILIGPPGSGKGSAMGPGIEILKKADVTWLIKDRITAPQMIARLSNNFQMSIGNSGAPVLKQSGAMSLIATELGILLDNSPWLITALCKTWDDSEFDYDTKHQGTYQAKNVSINVLAGCVPKYIQMITNTKGVEAVSGGFSSRCIFPYTANAIKADDGDFWGELNSKDTALEDQLVNDLKEIKNIFGEYVFEKAAADLLRDCTKKFDSDTYISEVVENFKTRIWAHIGKAALCLAASESNQRIVRYNHVEEAYRRVHHVYSNLDVAFRFASASPLAEGTLKIMDYIEKNGAVSFKVLLRMFHRDVTEEDLTRILLTLEGIDFLYRRKQGGGTIYVHNKAFRS